MRTLYLDCPTGLAGDMTLAALMDAGGQLGLDVQAAVEAAVASLRLDGVRLQIDEVMRGDFRARSLVVHHPKQHAHRHLSDVHAILDAGELTPAARRLAGELFAAVAEGEATVHGSTPEKVHFHEVGAIDSIVDITGVAVAFDALGIERTVCGPIPTGFGFVEIDHGVCPVPAPGTAEILKGLPIRDVPVEMELTTPTGAAIARVLADSFGRLPEMTLQAVGHGAGQKEIPGRANILRAFIGEGSVAAGRDEVILLETNLDDVSGEVIGHAKRLLLNGGALDVYSAALQMKKDRPGVLLGVLCRPSDADRLEEIVFRETGTLGVRRSRLERSIRFREETEVSTIYGVIRVKISHRAGHEPLVTPEFESAAEAAATHGVALRDVYRAAEAAGVPRTTAAATPPHEHSHSHSHDHSHEHSHSHDPSS